MDRSGNGDHQASSKQQEDKMNSKRARAVYTLVLTWLQRCLELIGFMLAKARFAM